MFELNKTYKDGYGNDMLIIYVNPDPNIEYPVVAVDKHNISRTFRSDGRHHISPDSPLNLILRPQPGEIWSSEGVLYHIFKSPETGSLMAINTEYFTLFVLDSDKPNRSRGGILTLDTCHVQ